MSAPSLLTAHLFVKGTTATAATRRDDIVALVKRLLEREIRPVIHSHDADPRAEVDADPGVYVTIGGSDADFPRLYDLPEFERKRWVHFGNAELIHPDGIFYCWLAATDPLPVLRPVPPSALSPTPLVSIFTAAYRSGTRIQRPFRSLLAQKYQNWEWVIMDDSGDDDATYQAHILPLADKRVRKFRQEKRSGYIGTVKRAAAGLCTGEILLELDHDDDLTPDCLQRLVDAFRRHPECGFAFGEAAEVFEETLQSRWYGWDSGFGFLTYWRQYDAVSNRFQDVPRTAGTNWKTIRHLVGLPNHPRAWTRECYFLVGGHRVGMSVADDYDLLIRSFLCTGFVRAQHLVYLQYVNAGGSNQTQQRNAQIQAMCAQVERYYKARIDARLADLQLPSLESAPYRRIWTCPDDDPAWRSAEVNDVDDTGRISYLFVFSFGDTQEVSAHLLHVLQQCEARDWRSSEVIAVGNVPEGVLKVAAVRAPPGAIRWWTTEPAWPPEDVARYGRMLGTGPTSQEFGTKEAGTLPAPPLARQPLANVSAYTLAAPGDAGRDRLSVLLHLRERFGYRRLLEVGCGDDEVFAQLNGFDVKVGVDPRAGGTHRTTADAYFAANRARPEGERDLFDLVLIQARHDYRLLLRDVENAMACLSSGGTIVLHDCMPFAESQQVIPRPLPIDFWTGDIWKAVFSLRQRIDIDLAVGCFDWGVGVLRIRTNAQPFGGLRGASSGWTWQDYCARRDEALNPLGYDDLLRWIDGADFTASSFRRS